MNQSVVRISVGTTPWPYRSFMFCLRNPFVFRCAVIERSFSCAAPACRVGLHIQCPIFWLAEAKSPLAVETWLNIQAWFWSNPEGWWFLNEVFRVLVRVKSPALIVMKVVGDAMRVAECPQSGSVD